MSTSTMKLPASYAVIDAEEMTYLDGGASSAYQSFLDAGCGHVRLKLYPGGRHEMLNEHNWQDVYDELLSWFDQQIK